MFFRLLQFRPFVRLITALAGILLMLAGEAPLVAWSAESAMDCCPDGHACCRRLQQSGATWQGDFCGMPGCGGGALGTVSIPLQVGAATAAPVPLTIAFETIAALLLLGFTFIQFTPEFFQRPPPSLL